MKLKLIAFILLAVNLFALTPQEKKDLLFMYEEEKLAKDVYQTLGKMYPNMRIFSNITRAEVMHNRAVANVLKHYNVELPSRIEEVGKFKNEELQKLYNELVAKGKKSLKDALEVGVMIEVIDIKDLDEKIANAKSPDVIALFKFLRDGSYNHYNAFNRVLKRVTGGKGACEIMDKKWCKSYPFKKGIGKSYREYYWFVGGVNRGHSNGRSYSSNRKWCDNNRCYRNGEYYKKGYSNRGGCYRMGYN